MKIGEKHYSLLPYIEENEGHADVYMKPASPESVELVLAASEDDDDGRSEWLWVRLPGGDLILGVYPQGDTYFETEGEHP